MTYSVIRSTSVLVCVVVLAGRCWLPTAGQSHAPEGPLLSTFREAQRQEFRGPLGSYRFSFSLPQQERAEERDETGKVTGLYAFVDKVGKEVSVNYNADHAGFRALSDSLPQPPKDTPDVAKAKEEFLRHYERTAQLLQMFDSDEDSESSEEDSSEEGEDSSEEGEDSDEEGEDSSSEESDEDSDEEEEEDDEEEEGGEEEYEAEGEQNEEENEEEGNEKEENEKNEVEEVMQEFGRRIPEQSSQVLKAIPVRLMQMAGGRALLTPIINQPLPAFPTKTSPLQ